MTSYNNEQPGTRRKPGPRSARSSKDNINGSVTALELIWCQSQKAREDAIVIRL